MKTDKTNDASAAPPPQDTVKIKTLKLSKETVQNLSDTDAGAIKGGQKTQSCSSVYSTI